MLRAACQIEESSMPLLVRVRPNAAYVVVMLVAAALAVDAIGRGGAVGILAGSAMIAILIVFASPIVRSSLVGTPALAVTREGLQFPLMGPRLKWNEVTDIQWSSMMVGLTRRPLLLVIPAVPEAVIRQVRPWLRRDVRRKLATYGTPLVLADTILDHSIDEIFAAIQHYRTQAGE
jgi:hypothetical protein